MQLSRGLLGGAMCLLMIDVAAAQSLAPMRKSGTTPSDIKGYRLTVSNPYPQHMVFELIPMEPGFVRLATGAQVNYPELALAPGYARQVIFSFRIPAAQKERTIGLCIQPKNIQGSVLPRVCGTYTGVRRTAGSGG